ncbi:MAG: HAMP domain-containing histidine kinase [Lachnospiraceae bacterium]|nr:HAMP domain-containing histidine kinase [Lachnospiraceae bacterium]
MSQLTAFKKTERKLTIYASVFISLIITVIGILYSYLTYRNMSDSTMTAFTNDINNIIVYIKNTPIIYSNIINQYTEKNYQIFIESNDRITQFGATDGIADSDMLLEEVKTAAREQYGFSFTGSGSAYVIRHIEFRYRSMDRTRFYISIAQIDNDNADLTVTILYPIAQNMQEIFRAILLIVLITICGDIVLCTAATISIRKLLRPISESYQKQNDFIAVASHELKTPLAIILSSLSAMTKSSKSEFYHHQSVAQDECRRMSALMEDMLCLAQADQNVLTLSLSEEHVEDIIIDCYNHFERLVYEKGLTFHVHITDGIPPCSLDRNKIMQLLIILMDNALSYTTQGSITLSCDYDGRYLLLSVADTGIGIPDSNKKLVFDRFYSSDKSHTSRKHQGLGLSIAKEITEIHKGTISISDTPGGGATITVSLPQKYR